MHRPDDPKGAGTVVFRRSQNSTEAMGAWKPAALESLVPTKSARHPEGYNFASYVDGDRTSLDSKNSGILKRAKHQRDPSIVVGKAEVNVRCGCERV